MMKETTRPGMISTTIKMIFLIIASKQEQLFMYIFYFLSKMVLKNTEQFGFLW
jgi:hypothetical protein